MTMIIIPRPEDYIEPPSGDGPAAVSEEPGPITITPDTIVVEVSLPEPTITLTPPPSQNRQPRFRKRATPNGTGERIQFTPEEEAQRDAEEAEWAARQPEREAEPEGNVHTGSAINLGTFRRPRTEPVSDSAVKETEPSRNESSDAEDAANVDADPEEMELSHSVDAVLVESRHRASVLIRMSAERRAVAVERIEDAITGLRGQGTEWTDDEGARVDQAVIALKWARSILTLDLERLPIETIVEIESDIRNSLEKVRDWLLRKADEGSGRGMYAAAVLALSRVLEAIF